MPLLSKTEEFKLTVKQNQAIELFSGDALHILLYGGSRSTKTFTAVRTIVKRALGAPNSRHAIVRFRLNHVKQSIVYDTFPKVMLLCFPGTVYVLNKSDWFVEFPNKSQIWFGGLDDKERTDKVLGNEYVTIFLNEVSQISYGSYLTLITRLAQQCYYVQNGQKHLMRQKMYLDENPPSMGHWTYRLFIEGKEPLSRSFIKNPEDYASLKMNPSDNSENLSDIYLKTLENLPKRKKKRFWEGLFSDETENSLWTSEILEKSCVNELPKGVDLVRIVVSVDPSGASDDENETNDDIGIGVAGLGTDGIGYVLEDLTINAGPAKWGKVVASAYERHNADRVIGESNFGGAMVEFVVRTANPDISYKSVSASRGKTIRAEPVSALHETGKIKLLGSFPDLEDELLSFTTTGYTGVRSPNRADWFVWAFTELFPGMIKKEHKEIDYSVPNNANLQL